MMTLDACHVVFRSKPCVFVVIFYHIIVKGNKKIHTNSNITMNPFTFKSEPCSVSDGAMLGCLRNSDALIQFGCRSGL